ncbi:MAG TPA: hypothetical protein VGK34_04120, partial [Armatimonadota bacterium]
MRVTHFVHTTVLAIALLALTALHAQCQGASPQFAFVVFGENRPELAANAQPETYKRVLKDADSCNPAFAINTGNALFGSSNNNRFLEQYKDYAITNVSNLRARVYLTLGFYDILQNKSNEDFFANEVHGLYYSFDYGNAHFTVLDSDLIGEGCRITGKQLEWLKNDLAGSSRLLHKFVFVNRPLFPVGARVGDSLDKYPKERDLLHKLFVKNHVTAVFSGCEQLFDSKTKDGVRYVITGGAGSAVYPSKAGTGDFHHYVLVLINGKTLEMRLIKLPDG